MNKTTVSPNKIPSLMSGACVVFVISILYCIFTARSLYDDGSYYFMRVLQAHGFTEMLFQRGHAAFLFQLPVVIAFKLGVTDLETLQIAFGIGCFMSWPIALWMCHRLAPEHFWLAALGCGAGYLNAAFVAVGEHLVTHAFFWPACFVILFVRPLTISAAVALLASVTILVRSYESMLFLGPLLGFLALQRGMTAEKSWQRLVFLLATFLLAASVFMALDGTFHPCTTSHANSFVIGVVSVLLSPDWTLAWTLLWLALMAGCWSGKIRGVISNRIARVFLAIAILVWGAWPLLAPAQLNPYKQYEARFLNLLVPIGLLAIAWICAHRPQWIEKPKKHLIHLTASLLLAQSLWHLGATEQWRGYLNVWRDMMARNTGIIDLTATPYWQQRAVGRQATHFVWQMDARDLCIAIGPRRVKSLIMPGVTESGEIVHGVFLKQFTPEELPNLKRYGVDYSEYIQTVRSQRTVLDEIPPKAK